MTFLVIIPFEYPNSPINCNEEVIFYVADHMPLSVKNATEITNICANWFKSIPSEVQVRVKEHSLSRVGRTAVHVVLEFNELVNVAYPHVTFYDAVYEENKKK